VVPQLLKPLVTCVLFVIGALIEPLSRKNLITFLIEYDPYQWHPFSYCLFINEFGT